MQDAQYGQPGQRITLWVQEIERVPSGKQDLRVVRLLSHPGKEGQRFGQVSVDSSACMPRQMLRSLPEVTDGHFCCFERGQHWRARGVGGGVRMEGAVSIPTVLPDGERAFEGQPRGFAEVRADMQTSRHGEGLRELISSVTAAKCVDLGPDDIVRTAEQHAIGTPNQAQTRGFNVGVGRSPPGAHGLRSPADGAGLQRKGQRRQGILGHSGVDEVDGGADQGADGLLRQKEGGIHGAADRLGLRNDPCSDLRGQVGEIPCLTRSLWRKRRGGIHRFLFLLFSPQNGSLNEQPHHLAEERSVVGLPSRGRAEINGQTQPLDCLTEQSDGFGEGRLFGAAAQGCAQARRCSGLLGRAWWGLGKCFTCGRLERSEAGMIGGQLESACEGACKGQPASRPHGGRFLGERGYAGEQLDSRANVGQAVGERAVDALRPVAEGEAERAVAVRAGRRGEEQGYGFIECGQITVLLGVEHEVARVVHRVLPRVVVGRLGEAGPQLAGHTSVIGQIQQTEDMHRPQVVEGRERGVTLGERPRQVICGNRVQDVGIHCLLPAEGLASDRDQVLSGLDPHLIEYVNGCPAFTEPPNPVGQLPE